MTDLAPLLKARPHRALAYCVLFFANVLLGIAAFLLFSPSSLDSFDGGKLMLIGAVCAVPVNLAYVCTMMAAMSDEIATEIRARAALVGGASFVAVFGVLGLVLFWWNSELNWLIGSLVAGWLLLGLVVRSDTVKLEQELAAWRAGNRPSHRCSHYYWTRREELFSALIQVDLGGPRSHAHDNDRVRR